MEDVFPGHYARLTQVCHYILVGYCEFFIFSTLEGLKEDAVAVDVDHHHDVLDPLLRPHRELDGLIGEDGLPNVVDLDVYAMLFLALQHMHVASLEGAEFWFRGPDILVRLVHMPLWGLCTFGVVLLDIPCGQERPSYEVAGLD